MKTEIGKRIEILMKNAGHNKNTLSKELGISYNGLSKIINNSNPTYKSILMILEYFSNVSLQWLMFGEGKREKQLENDTNTMVKGNPKTDSKDLIQLKTDLEQLTKLVQELVAAQAKMRQELSDMQSEKE